MNRSEEGRPTGTNIGTAHSQEDAAQHKAESRMVASDAESAATESDEADVRRM